MPFSTIHRQSPDNSVKVSTLLPNADYFIAIYGHLIERGEALTLEQFSDRISAHSEHPRCQIEAGTIRRWSALMNYARDHMKHFYALPMEFEFSDGLYSFEDCIKILGQPAIDYLMTCRNVA